MANEYLVRTPTSTGNRKIFTWSGWFKRAFEPSTIATFFQTMSSSTDGTYLHFESDGIRYRDAVTNGTYRKTNALYRDNSAWSHILLNVNTTHISENDRIKLYVNGIQLTDFSTTNNPALNADLAMNIINKHLIGAYQASSLVHTFEGELADIFMVDGQALTPDVFGFYKEGNGYISAGSTEATDFRPGQWSPKKPKTIKAEINRRGGFGVNGYYLPMNDSSNFGADFHCAPNSIITLKGEDLPQPRNGAPETTDAYVSQLREDPYASNLVLAIPFIAGGQGSGAGDYSADIKGTGTNKTVTLNGTFSVGECASYYGSALKGSSGNRWVEVAANSDFANLYDVDHTIEFWYKNDSWNGFLPHNDIIGLNVSGTTNTAWRITFTDKNLNNQIEDGIELFGDTTFSTGPQILNNDWNHCAVVQEGNNTTIYINGVAQNVGGKHGYAANKSSTGPIIIGADPRVNPQDGSTYLFNGQLQDIRIYKGVAKYKGGFDVLKPYTPVGIEPWRAVSDTTANNFATWNALQSSIPLTDGNLTCTGSGNNQETYSTVGITTGKWYVEARTNVGSYNHFGLRANSTAAYDASYRLIARDDGLVFGDTSEGLIATLSDNYNQSGDIVAMAIDGDNGQVTYYINGVNVGGPYSIYQYSSAPTPYKIYNLVNSGNSLTINFGQNPTFNNLAALNKNRVNNGTGDDVWHQSSNGGAHVDWTVSAGGTKLDVTVPSGNYARVYLLASDGTIDPKKTYLISFKYVTGPANLGINNDGGYMTAVDGTVAPNGFSSGNYYSFILHGSQQFFITGFQGSTYSLDNIVVSDITECYTDDTGKGKFHYQPPSGFLALCEDNLPTPVIKNPGEHFKTVLYEGDNSAGRRINVGFQPDLIWFKSRNTGVSNVLCDSVRGFGHLNSNGTNVESTSGTLYLSGYANNGFDLSDGVNSGGNTTGRTYVAWCWKAGGPAVTNTDGTITSQVSVNQDAGGFSIATYTATGSTGSIGHGLGKTPAFVITKHRNLDTHWRIWHKGLSGYNYTLFFNTVGEQVQPAYSALPTDSVINLGGDLTGSYNFVTYSWAEIEGFSKFGSYVGNGAPDDGPFVFCGFKPALVICKNINASGNWVMSDSSRDSSNPVFGYQVAESGAIEERGNPIFDFLSNGFKIRNSWVSINGSGNTIIFAAFAESPFQTANAK